MKDNKEFEINKNLRLIFKSSAIFFIGMFLAKVLSYVYRVLIAREFGPEIYGVFSLAVMVAGWFMAFSALGLNEGLLRYIPFYRGREENEKIKYLFRFSLGILIITSCISGIILFLFSDFIAVSIFNNETLAIFLKYFSILVPLLVISHPFLEAMRSFEHIGWYSFIFNIIQSIAKVAALAILIVLGMGSDSIIFSYLFGMFCVLIGSYLFCRIKMPELFTGINLDKPEKRKLKIEILSYSIPLLFSAIVSTIFYWVDTFSLGYLKGAVAAGFYNAVIPIALLVSILPELLMQLFYPLINKEYSRNNREIIKQLSQQMGKWILIINLPLVVLLLLFPNAAINIIFGSEYLIGANALRILSIGTLISSIFIISSRIIFMMGKSKLLLTNIIAATIINFILNFILIPLPNILFLKNESGLVGAATATLLSVLFLNVLFLIEANYYLSIIPLRRKVFRIILVTAISSFLLVTVRDFIGAATIIHIIFLVILFFLVYATLIWFTNCLDKYDLSILKMIRSRIGFLKNVTP